MSTCPNCGGSMVGDGFSVVRHCELADDVSVWDSEPDAPAILCVEEDGEAAESQS